MAEQMHQHYQIWRTDDVSPEEGFSYFRDAVCEAFMELTPSISQPQKFLAVVESRQVNQARINKVHGNSHSVVRTKIQTNRMSEHCYYLNLQLKSRSVISQGERQCVLNPGQIALFDGNLPFGVDHPDGDDVSLVSMQLPHRTIAELAHTYDVDQKDLCGTRISDHPVLGPLANTTMRLLAQQSNLISNVESQALLDNLARLAIVARSGNTKPIEHERSPGRPALRLAVLDYIERNLSDPGLSVNSTASKFCISQRYLHKLFETSGKSFSQHVRERRLERVHADLMNPDQAHQTILQIAMANGFWDLSSFNKRFKEYYGMSPGEIR